ncbi:MAG TPA: glutamyl-tRNA reductase [Nocardioides sp.]|jgi:glutamyl-tRNA reductase|uniref:glutamyl-tRNA reductase n=1 Tax=Nocardioides sp. TaxID=35761 RepID=UPI002E37E8DE|nr:glutamyl-tRNA reductase [Nocardioides sp.]HEX3929454.1 glutamyl-tRNA reductase [Nocardioides sp.]
MTALVVGLSHRSAPIALLERLAVDSDGATKLIEDVLANPHVSEATVVATCNRLEIYAAVDRFHGSVEDISGRLLEPAGESVEALSPHLYVHYDDGAVSHLFQVAAGLDSMAVGEVQVLGQTREALSRGQELGSVGPVLNTLFQQALRVGKRAHAETGIDRAAPTLVSAALDRAAEDLRGRRVVVVGAGGMAALAVATVVRRGAGEVVVLNRTAERAQRLATEYAVRSAPLTSLDSEVAAADVVVACAGASGLLVSRQAVAAAEQPLALVDLALPHDIDPGVADLPGVTLVALADLGEDLRGSEVGVEVDAVRRIVTDEVEAFLSARRRAGMTPTVVALRSMATGVVESELARLERRLPDLDPATRAELLHTLRRVADKLVHQPTIRAKELGDRAAVSYATALAELFALDPDAVDAVTRPVVSEESATELPRPPSAHLTEEGP